jgi:hypothetical protein
MHRSLPETFAGMQPMPVRAAHARMRLVRLGVLIGAVGTASPVSAQEEVPVNADTFVRAESDLYFSGIVANGGFATFDHTRDVTPMDKQTVIRLNRDTLYSAAVFDLDAGPVTITMPDPGDRFMSLQIIDQDHFTHGVHYAGGDYALDRDGIGTRYVAAAVRLFADPNDPQDLAEVRALQDAIAVSQEAEGSFEVPDWNDAMRDAARAALLELAAQLPDTRGMFGAEDEVDPVRHLIGAAMGWGGNPEREALYLNVVPERNDGATVYTLEVGEVPVDGFWSISVYNAEGFFEPNDRGAYTLNNVTAEPGADGTVTVRFGGCDGVIPNCIPVTDGWNYMVRLYRPQEAILSGAWSFPSAEVAP